MANRYWVGDGGNWSDSLNHWSASDGGAANASKPTSADNVFFTANSFTIGAQTVTVDETANCLDMDWTGATDTPTFAGAQILNLYGSLTFIAGMTQTYSREIRFQATATGKTVTVAKTLDCGLSFLGAGGGWTLQDAVNLGVKNLNQDDGTLDTNGQTITCGVFQCFAGGTRVLTLGASVITCTGVYFDTPGTLTFNPNTSTIIVSEAATTTRTFTGGGLTFNNVTQAGAGAFAMTIQGSNTFNVLTIDRSAAAKTVKFTDGTTQTVTNLVIATSGTTIVTLQGTSTAGWTISDAVGTNSYSYLTISYSAATGGATWEALTANGNIDSGGNSGWDFGVISGRGWMRGLVRSGRRHRFSGRR